MHIVMFIKEGQPGTFCKSCGIKVLDIEPRPCKDCTRFKKVAGGGICTKLLMAVIPEMNATYYISKGTCFEANPAP